jgi:WD domain, G-beta repeat/TIR domain
MADATARSASRVFISYRREETAYAAISLFDRLAIRFGRAQIFKDIDSIQLGDDFGEVIADAVASCDVLLALIGKQWVSITDEQGRRRLDNPDDFVRLEIEAALTRNVRIIPILVASARMPRVDELPPSLTTLVRRQALELGPTHFESDTNRLLQVIDSTLAGVDTGPAVQSDHPLGGDEPPAETARPRGGGPVVGPAPSVPQTRRTTAERSLTGPKRKTSRVRLTIAGILALLVVAAAAVVVLGNTLHRTAGAGVAFTFDRTLSSHTNAVRSVAFSPDGILAGGGADGVTRLWDVTSGRPLGQLTQGGSPNNNKVVATAFDETGDLLATGSSDGTIRLWNPRLRQPQLTKPIKNSVGVKSLAFRPRSRTLASADSDGSVRFWDISTGEPTADFKADQTTAVEGLAFNQDGTILATGSWDGTVKLWDANSQQQIGPALIGHTGRVYTVSFNHDSSILASASEDGTVRLWNVAKREPLSTLTGHRDSVIGAAFSPTGSILASGNYDGFVRLWDAATGKPAGDPLGDGKTRFTGVAFSPNGDFLSAGTAHPGPGDSSVWLWKVN